MHLFQETTRPNILYWPILGLLSCGVEQFNEPELSDALAQTLSAEQKVQDFLIEDVCLESDGSATNEDPWVCPERRRNRRMTDAVTYVKRTPEPFSGARGNSYPTQGTQGEFRVAVAHELGKSAWFDKNLGEGTDVLEASGTISALNTEDQGGNGNTPFRRYWKPGCINEDAWSYFPTAIFKQQKTGVAQNQIGVSADCAQRFQDGWYSWAYEPALDFGVSSGVRRVMPAIVSRQGPDDPNRPSYFEEVHFTAVYGVTRWSTWRQGARSTASDTLAEKCALPTSVALKQRTFVPGACNNLVQIDALPQSEWRSTFSWPIHDSVSGSSNAFPNGDFAFDSNGWNGVVARLVDARSNGFGECSASCFVQTRLQPANTNNRTQIFYGARVWTAGSAEQVTVTVSVFRNASWVVLGSVAASVSATPRLVMSSTAAKRGEKIRLSFQAATGATQIRVDDAYASFAFSNLY